MSLYTAATSERERVRADAQLARATEQSRHEITKLALELLQQRHGAQHVVNVENKQRATALVEGQFSAADAEIAARHGQEVTNLEAAKFALFEEFDTRWGRPAPHCPNLARQSPNWRLCPPCAELATVS